MLVVGKRLLFAGLGLLATSIAIIGVWLPGVPTVFPVIVALWAFSKSSTRLHTWVGHLPLFRQALIEAQRFERERTISWQVKLIAQSSAWLSTAAVYAFTRNALLTVSVAAAAVACSIFMVITPTRDKQIAKVQPIEDASEAITE